MSTPQLPEYWLPRPPAALEPAHIADFDALLDRVQARADGSEIAYTLPAPKWAFLSHAADRRGLAMHGSGDGGIVEFEPRQSNDLSDFGNQKAVYAAADGIWAMFFAIADRDRYGLSVINACIRLVDTGGAVHGPFYVFSVSRQALSQRPWRTGTVYLLPRAGFVKQPYLPFSDLQVEIAQLASFSPVRPLARLTVTPDDFPFLAQMRGHNDHRLADYARALETGSPWPAE
jgi:hypothetical protein